MNQEEDILKHRKIKPTAVRLLVLRELMEVEKAVSLKDLEQTLVHSDKSTIFRTLKTFEQQRLIHSIADGSGVTKYALCLESCECEPQDQHIHFHCNKCGETYCLTNSKIPQTQIPSGFKAASASMVYKGTCANCS